MRTLSNVLWSSHTTYELKRIIEEENPIVIVTVGATEQHGTHLAINTDTDLGFSLAQRVAQASPIRTLVLPPVWSGFSPHHMDFTGTITLRQSTLFAMVNDIIECLIRHGVERVLLLNSHGGNISLLKTVVDEIGVQHGISPVYVTYWNLISDVIGDIRESEMGGISHACELETSLKMLFSPEDVRQEEIRDVMLDSTPYFGNDMFAPNKYGVYKPFKAWTELGQIGAPSLASKEKGERIADAIIAKFADLIQVVWGGEEAK
ncbi:creatininase family protein [Cohnella candidum]|uniref:creatininase family protein n=1 Tax=Cohnella candidum TaxID=2674991 RepID=UPI0013DDBCBC|nr:creatininase family protein [Cohnella candidum]